MKAFIIIIILVIIGVIGWSAYSGQDMSGVLPDSEKTEESMMEEDEAMMKEGEEAMMEEEGTMMKDEESVDSSTPAPAADKGAYEPYSPEKLALANEGDVVLFFHAPWCPTCRALDANINANLQNIPAGVTVLKVDYDNSTALKQRYGVTYQHTLVQVDASGNQLAKWSNSSTLESLLKNII